MKIIDLLNKIANGEHDIKIIKYDGDIFKLDAYYNYVHEKDINEYEDLFDSHCWNIDLDEFLNNEVEIIGEDKKDNFTGWKMYQDGKEVCSMDCSAAEEKKIPEKLEEYIHTDSLNYNQCNYMFEKLTNKYNELINYLDYLKSKGE